MTDLRIAGRIAESGVNGPGRRAVVHLQGCTLGCGGCFNPETHPHAGGELIDADALATWLAGQERDGVTISGGEPFQQAAGLTALVLALRGRGVDSILVFTGYAVDELAEIPDAAAALTEIDVLVAGRFDAARRTDTGITASDNQRVHFLTDRHTPEEMGDQGGVEITILPDGRVVLTGFPSPALRRGVRGLGRPSDD